jgi:hypothetical protein
MRQSLICAAMLALATTTVGAAPAFQLSCTHHDTVQSMTPPNGKMSIRGTTAIIRLPWTSTWQLRRSRLRAERPAKSRSQTVWRFGRITPPSGTHTTGT